MLETKYGINSSRIFREKRSRFTLIAEAYEVDQVIYAHCHGKERFHDSLLGNVNGIKYSLVSGDYLDFKPQLILK